MLKVLCWTPAVNKRKSIFLTMTHVVLPNLSMRELCSFHLSILMETLTNFQTPHTLFVPLPALFLLSESSLHFRPSILRCLLFILSLFSKLLLCGSPILKAGQFAITTPLASRVIFAHKVNIVISALVAAASTSLGCWHLEGNHHFLFISVASENVRRYFGGGADIKTKFS